MSITKSGGSLTENMEILNKSEELFFENRIWLTTREAALYLCTSSTQIRNWVYQGKINFYRLLNRKLLFKKSDLDSLIKKGGEEWR